MTINATRGVTYPWTLLLSIAIGVWLTFTRPTFDSFGAMANSDHLVGLLVVTFAIMALAEVARSVRFINVAFGAWLIAAPWLLDGVTTPLATWNAVICGALLIAVALPRGPVRDSYAGWDRSIHRLAVRVEQHSATGISNECNSAQRHAAQRSILLAGASP